MYMTGFADEASPALDIQTRVTKELGWRDIESRNVQVDDFPAGWIHDISDAAFDRLAVKLEEAGIRINCFDAIELNEAFAAQALACIKELNWDADRVNPNGGAIALGHPIGASGAHLLVHLAHRIARGKLRKALATLCVGGGMGSAVMLEKA